MIQKNSLLGVLGVVLTMAGCARDSVVFVTKTSLSIVDVDTTPAAISVAYDRVEGYLGPSYESGEVPAVLGYFASDGEFFRPNVRQVYATGNAARILADQDPKKATIKCSPSQIVNENRVMFFGTSTTTGLKIGFGATAPASQAADFYVPDSFVFGWRRKKISVIPLSQAKIGCPANDAKKLTEVKVGGKFYPATLGTINTQVDVTAPRTGKMNTQQFFATGDAATLLSRREDILKTLKKIVIPADDQGR